MSPAKVTKRVFKIYEKNEALCPHEGVDMEVHVSRCTYIIHIYINDVYVHMQEIRIRRI